MNVLALLLAAVAIVLFLANHFAVPRKWATQPLGLAFLTLAIVVQFVWLKHHVTITGG